MGWNLKGSFTHLSLSTAASNQLIAWTFDPTMTNNPYTPGQGKCLVAKTYVDVVGTVGNFYSYVITAGSGLANCFMGLYNSAGALLGQTADISTKLQSTGNITAAISPSAYTGLTTGQQIFLVLLLGSGTSPAFTSTQTYDANLNSWWQSGGTGLTALPGTLPGLTAAGSQPPFLAIGI